MHIKRWLTAIIGLPILIYTIGFAPRWVFYLLLLLASLVSLTEFYRLTASDLPKPVIWSGYLSSLLLFLVVYTGKIFLFPVIIATLAFFPMTILVTVPNSSGLYTASRIGKGLFGPIYICLPLSMLMIMDRHPQGNIWIFFLLAIIFSSDTGAFYCGRYLGKHKLHEKVSPGKTWEGAVGGIIGSVVAALWFLHVFPLHKTDLCIINLVIGLSVVGQIGDLAESMLKRSQGVKDSGFILPGHGGLLDRIDGLLFAIPVLYVYFHLCIV